VEQVVHYWTEAAERAGKASTARPTIPTSAGTNEAPPLADGAVAVARERPLAGSRWHAADSSPGGLIQPVRTVLMEGRGFSRMAPTLYRDTGYTLAHLIEDIKHGSIVLPDIQRPFVWSGAKTRDLFDSMYRGYPVGTLMFWETGAEVGTRQIGSDDSEDRIPKLLVVDGQQRLTSLFAVLTGSPVVTKAFEERRIRLGFRPLDETFEVTDAAIERDPEFVPDITRPMGPGLQVNRPDVPAPPSGKPRDQAG
jgi:Protein of unknown function DUF262